MSPALHTKRPATMLNPRPCVVIVHRLATSNKKCELMLMRRATASV